MTMQNKPKFQALNYNVIVEEKVLENKTGGGFDMTNYIDATEKQQSGEIICFGELCPKRSVKIFGFRIPYLREYTLRKGQVIVFNKFNSTPMMIGGKPYLIIPYSNIFLAM